MPHKGYCSFCRKKFIDVGPLVEGPDHVYICAECVELCAAIIDEERRRRNPASPLEPARLRDRLDRLIHGQDEAKQALLLAANSRQGPRQHALLVGGIRSTRLFLARALAHVLGVPFAVGDAKGLAEDEPGAEPILILLHDLLRASDFDISAAQQGIVYLDGVERTEAQMALLRIWRGEMRVPADSLDFNVRGVQFICGDGFRAFGERMQNRGPHPTRADMVEILIAIGALPEWADHLGAIARTVPLDEATLTRILAAVNLSQMENQGVESATDNGS